MDKRKIYCAPCGKKHRTDKPHPAIDLAVQRCEDCATVANPQVSGGSRPVRW